MKKTLAWPPRLENGGLAMTASPDDPDATDRGEALRQIVRLCVLPGENANPWNPELGVPDGTFQPDRLRDRATVEARIRTRFSELERQRRARLVSVTFGTSTDGGLQTRTVALVYEDLEQGGRENLEVSING